MSAKKPKLLFTTPDAIREHRRKHGLNQFEFWSRLGVTQSGGSRYENGRNIPTSVQLLLQIAYGTPKQAAAMVAWLQARRPDGYGELADAPNRINETA
ncbi:MAG: transcriptional regulator [Betaproteobacteria bacterium HGW-Betaproteobacteria-13]|jgi:transcriptional regulator with XRE-family HTH domain|nr:MAG: transcriptional regulator [Betaproteobacteria bacterium HGW-Betaproteobacteria-13]